LPGATPAKDLAMFKKLFSDARFQPDQIKFYPTVVTRGSLLYRWWQQGKYRPYSAQQLENLIIACKKIVPKYVRIIRLIRDIPSESIIAGNIVTNLRQIMQQRGAVCNCIRCREPRTAEFKMQNAKFKIIQYATSIGKEFFLSFESKDEKTLYGFLRLTLYGQAVFNITSPVLHQDTALIRELHVYGELVPVGQKKIIQHSGLGKKLMAIAEKIARENGYKKISVISGIGVRNFYRKAGYRLSQTYMLKSL
jgi:elongator complex protein 3